MLNEMLDFGNGVTGLALNLEETEVGAIILGDYTKVEEGSEVRTTGVVIGACGPGSRFEQCPLWQGLWRARGAAAAVAGIVEALVAGLDTLPCCRSK